MVRQLSPACAPSTVRSSNSAWSSWVGTPQSPSWYAIISGSVPAHSQRVSWPMVRPLPPSSRRAALQHVTLERTRRYLCTLLVHGPCAPRARRAWHLAGLVAHEGCRVRDHRRTRVQGSTAPTGERRPHTRDGCIPLALQLPPR